MLKTLRLVLIITLAMLCGCGKNEVNLRFALPKELSTNIRLVYYASNKKGGLTLEKVATVVDGKGELRTPVANPSLLYLYAGGNVPTVVYAERNNKIEITGSESNPSLWSIGGNEINEEMTLWRNAHATTLFSGTPAEINEAVADYVTLNPDNAVSAILLLTAYSRSENEIGFLDLWYSLGDKVDKERWVRMAGRADMPTIGPRRYGILKNMPLRSLANGVDTIRPSAVNATIMFFWNNGMDNRRELIDSLKVLAKEFPDSSARMIADICLDADSLSWRSPLRSDSVKKIARFWVPAGLADRYLMALQVTRTPFFMVVAPNGIQTYRGDDAAKAMTAFRALADTTTNSKTAKK